MKLKYLSIVLLLTVSGCFAQKDKPLFPQKPGMVSYTYRNSFKTNVAATLDTIRSLGVTDMEFSNLFGKTAAELRKLLDERGMICSSFGVSYPDATTKTDAVAADAKALGASYVRISGIPRNNKTPFTVEEAKKAANDFNAAGKILKEKYNLTLVYHNHGFEFRDYEDGTLFDYIVKNTDPEYVSFEMDILWVVHPGKDPVSLLEKYGKRFHLMHLKDLKKGVVGDFSGGTPVDNDVALGTGQMNIPAILKAAKKAGIKHYYIEDESTHISTQVPQSIAYLKSL
ncbi:sugar phosphate isomerase/epimerase family protein [Hufsiella ginkgonis]|uniref:TIM barrel protein n=1 Tax=Hufsiella ginkgonis TaxID=2695274 RepID=A0A7K1XVX9_9SPHI|nr:TIM barrel protein [Hufsiella ginkgonis]MXV15145.1 TIM barrel protein [Hufsiella ginkgonis]